MFCTQSSLSLRQFIYLQVQLLSALVCKYTTGWYLVGLGWRVVDICCNFVLNFRAISERVYVHYMATLLDTPMQSNALYSPVVILYATV